MIYFHTRRKNKTNNLLRHGGWGKYPFPHFEFTPYCILYFVRLGVEVRFPPRTRSGRRFMFFTYTRSTSHGRRQKTRRAVHVSSLSKAIDRRPVTVRPSYPVTQVRVLLSADRNLCVTSVPDKDLLPIPVNSGHYRVQFAFPVRGNVGRKKR